MAHTKPPPPRRPVAAPPRGLTGLSPHRPASPDGPAQLPDGQALYQRASRLGSDSPDRPGPAAGPRSYLGSASRTFILDEQTTALTEVGGRLVTLGVMLAAGAAPPKNFP